MFRVVLRDERGIKDGIINMKVRFKKLTQSAVCPTYGTEFSAGADLYAANEVPVVIGAHETAMIPTGIAIELERGTVGLICARSGLASKRDLAPATKVGVIDCDYRGEIRVALHNHGSAPQTVEPHERIAQLVITPYVTAEFEETDELSDTVRGAGGFGSTGN